MAWAHLYQHILNGTNIALASDTSKYRKMARESVLDTDTVLEVGCADGQATTNLAKHAKTVFAIDNSYEFIERCKSTHTEHTNTQFHRLDARDISAVKKLTDKPDVIFIDIGGNASLENIASILHLYLLNFTPRLWVIRNYELAILYHLIKDCDLPSENQTVHAIARENLDHDLENMLLLSKSPVTADRMFAAKKLLNIQDPKAKARLDELKNDTANKVRRICQHQNS